jgi:cation:H+ antiporter
VKRNYIMMISASLLFIAACGYGGLYFWTGIAFLFLLGAMMFDAYLMAKQSRIPADIDIDDNVVSWPGIRIGVYILGGVIGLPIGAHLLIVGAQSVAVEFGISEAAIGLTLVAIGTSLPELATTVMAAIRRQADVAVGNVVGSNLFNILAVAGVASLVDVLPTPAGFLELDLWIMLASALIIAPFILLRKDIGRIAGLIFILAYVVYVVMALGPRM